MKRYYFYLIEDDFYSLFRGDNLKAFLELFYRKEDSSYYEKQFSLFVKEIDNSIVNKIIRDKYECRKDFIIEDNKYMLDNFITSSKEIMKLYNNYIYVETDYEVSPFITTLADNFPDLVAIDVNNYKIERIGLVSLSKIS